MYLNFNTELFFKSLRCTILWNGGFIMKKFISLSFVGIILFSSIGTSIADVPLKGSIKDNVVSDVPQWSEFCPSKYLNIKEAKAPNTFVDVLLLSTIILVPVAISHMNEYGNTIYWVERRKQFDSEVSICLADNSKSASDCFINVRKAEQIKNASWKDFNQDLASTSAQIMVPAIGAFAQGLSNVSTINNVNTNPNVVNSSNTGSVNNSKSKFQSCQNRCEAERITCQRGVQSTPTFGNDISASRNSHLVQCDLNYSNCLARCSY